MNFPSMEHQAASSDEMILNDDKVLSRNIEALAQENEDFLQSQQMIKPFQAMRLDKPNFEQ